MTTNQSKMRRTRFRPSSLDKLALCGLFCGDENRGQSFKERGDGFDITFREWVPRGLTDEARKFCDTGLAWAIDQTRELAEGSTIYSDKENCTIGFANFFQQPGEADAIIPARLCHIDLKSGQEYDYRLQQTAYALGLMENYFADSWTAFVLYCDLQRVVSYRFTYKQALAIIEGERKNYDDPGRAPQANEYCDWCVNFPVCPATRHLAGQALMVREPAIDFEAILADANKLGTFLEGCKAIEEYHKRAKESAIKILLHGGHVPGWKMISRKGSDYVEADSLIELGLTDSRICYPAIIKKFGNMGGEKYRELCALFGVEPKAEHIKQSGGSVYLKQTKQANK